MLFSQLRRHIAKYVRVLLFYYVVLIGLLVLTPTGRQIVDAIGQSYIDTVDVIKRVEAAEGKWQAFESLGNISRHHRYAELKTQVWSDIMENESELDKSHRRWANKNKRNIAMQLQLAAHYAAQGKDEKRFKLLRRLYLQVPNHPELTKAYQAAAAAVGHQGDSANSAPDLQEYFAK